jgi:hypothetical protein
VEFVDAWIDILPVSMPHLSAETEGDKTKPHYSTWKEEMSNTASNRRPFSFIFDLGSKPK